MNSTAVNKPAGIDTSVWSIVKIALPISIGTFVQFIIVFTDNFFLSKLGVSAINGGGMSGLIYATLIMVGVGLSSGAQILIARRNGQKKYKEAGEILVNTGIIALLFSCVLFFIVKLPLPYFLRILIQSDATYAVLSDFLSIRAYGFFFYMITLVFMSLVIGIAYTRILIYTTLLMAVVNILMNYCLIFGHWGFPEMGVQGAALATLLAEASTFLLFFIYLWRNKRFRIFELRSALKHFPLKHSRPILKLSAPLMGQQVLALSTWSAFFLLVEKLGDVPLMISQVIRSLYMLAFVSIMGMAQTTKTYISALIAEHRQSELNGVIKKLIIINFTGVIILCHGMWLYPEVLASLFSQDPHIISEAAKVMRVVMVAMLIFSVSSIFLNTVEGSGLTLHAFMAEIAGMIFYLITTYLITVVYPQDLAIVWMNDYIYFSVIGGISALILWKSKWKTNII